MTEVLDLSQILVMTVETKWQPDKSLLLAPLYNVNKQEFKIISHRKTA